nr:taurine dioxygenase [Catenulispora sp.]
MIVRRGTGNGIGVAVDGFDAPAATDEEVAELARLVYEEKIVVLTRQEITAADFVALGRRFGEPEVYYQPMYRHPEHEEIFVSSNIKGDDGRVGVPRTGEFWHADYQFMPRPFGITMVYPQVVPTQDRGTYFIDMAKAYQALPADLRAAVDDKMAWHSARRYFKIRPSDVYRPIQDVLEDIEKETPAVAHPAVFPHPVTGERILYISAALTYALDGADDDLLRVLLSHCGQLDESLDREEIHLQVLNKGDLLIWDNRALVHRARHAGVAEPASSFRVTVHDAYPFHPGLADR